MSQEFPLVYDYSILSIPLPQTNSSIARGLFMNNATEPKGHESNCALLLAVLCSICYLPIVDSFYKPVKEWTNTLPIAYYHLPKHLSSSARISVRRARGDGRAGHATRWVIAPLPLSGWRFKRLATGMRLATCFLYCTSSLIFDTL